MDSQKQSWLNNNGALLDGGVNPDSKMFALLANGQHSSQYSYIKNNINRILADESWWSGNRGAGLIALQTYLWFGRFLQKAELDLLEANLSVLPGDDNYWATRWNNGNINIVTVRYIMSQFNKSATCQYGWIGNESTPEAFTWQGRSYKIGQRYNTFQLCEDWLYNWIDRYYQALYLEGEMFSETYGYHYLNGLITLADSRMVQNQNLRQAAERCANFFLFEHGVNTNHQHLAGPLGRTYMNQHLTGLYMFFPFYPYFGFMPEVHYGTSNSWYISEFALEPKVFDFVNGLDECEIFSKAQGGRYVLIHPKFTLGSNPNGGNWLLQIVSNDPGVTPKSRLGQPFRFWMNNNPDDLNESACTGECYSEMGQAGHQYKDSIMIAMGGCIVHNPMIKTNWDIIQKNGNWNFGLENGVCVAWTIGPDSAGLEVAVIGESTFSFDEFKNQVLATSLLNGYTYRNRRGEYLSKNNSDETVLNGKVLYKNLPRLEVIKIDGEVYDFERILGMPPSVTIPNPPTGVRIQL